LAVLLGLLTLDVALVSCSSAPPHISRQQVVGTWVGSSGAQIYFEADGMALLVDIPSEAIGSSTARGVTSGRTSWKISYSGGSSFVQFGGISMDPSRYNRFGWFADFEQGRKLQLRFWIGDPDLGKRLLLKK
jgi:hypothetical protein